jgi:DNA-nicking Smr family endonuclease
MARKKKRKKDRSAPTDPPALSGIALLLVESPVETLDLHGLNARQAETRVRFFLQRHGTTSPGRVVHIITGKGTRSEGEPVLPGLVREMLQDDLGRVVAEWAALHGGGGFAVRIGGDVTKRAP